MHDLRQSRTEGVGGALLVGAHWGQDDAGVARDLLDELVELVDTLGCKVASTHLVRLKSPQPRLLIGSGKAEELAALAKESGCDLIIFDNALSPAQQRNWEKLTEGVVIDREEVILEIFARRARTREARLQVGLALMEYSLPRLTRAWAHLSRQGGSAGGLGAKGEGETQLETDRRIVRRRIERYREELEQIRSQRKTQRKQRQRRPVPVGAIVGYTNAGKSSMLRALTGADVFVEDRLFATLDTTTRRLALPSGGEVLLTDTVGFVRRLPHQLVESFKATLEEAAEADFLIHVLDVNNPAIFEFHRTTMGVLAELGAASKPTITALNKIDLGPGAEQVALARREFSDALMVSAETGEGLENLVRRIGEVGGGDWCRVTLALPVDRYGLVGRLRELGNVLAEEHNGRDVRVSVRMERRWLGEFGPYLVDDCGVESPSQYGVE